MKKIPYNILTVSVIASMVVWLLFPDKVAIAAIAETGSATNSGTGTAVSVTHGLTINSGDVVIAVVHANENSGGGQTDISDNNGASSFTEVFEENHPGTSGCSSDSRYAIYSRVAGASEPSSYAFTLASSQTWTFSVRVFSGVNTSSIWDVTPSTSTRNTCTATGTTATAPTMTVNTAGAVGIVVVFTDSTVSYSSPTNSYAGEVEVAVTTSHASYTRTFTATGSSGTTDVTQSATQDWFAHQFALKPAAPDPAGTAGAINIRGGVKVRGGVIFR